MQTLSAHRSPAFLLGLCAALISASGYSKADPLNTKTAAPEKNSPAANTNAMKLTKVTSIFTEGDVIGAVESGSRCQTSEPREWSQLLQQRIENDLPLVFQTELSKINTQSPSALAQVIKTSNNLEIQASINNLQINTCSHGYGAWNGSMSVQVNWQVVQGDQIVYQTTTTGAVNKSQTSQASSASLREAFAAAIRGFLGHEERITYNELKSSGS
jgi:hypothetical protein